MNEVTRVLAQYTLNEATANVQPIGNGLINQTYLVSGKKHENKQVPPRYVLQKINHHVFTEPRNVCQNADLISKHLQAKASNDQYPLTPIYQLKNIEDNTLTFLHDGAEKPSYWRILNYVDNSYTVEQLLDTKQAILVGKAFGDFSHALSDFPAHNLHCVIENFHNIHYRHQQLRDASSSTGSQNRKAQAQALMHAYAEHDNFLNEVSDYEEKLPVHLTHNDTKINNLLFDKGTKAPIAVVDLDTCMPGFFMNDFGDMVRTCCVNKDENHQNTADIIFDVNMFTALATGYVGALRNTITPEERESLVVGCLLQPLMLSMRFLADYLNGDTYFTTTYEEHNLHRAKNQFAVFKRILTIRQQLTDIVTSV